GVLASWKLDPVSFTRCSLRISSPAVWDFALSALLHAARPAASSTAPQPERFFQTLKLSQLIWLRALELPELRPPFPSRPSKFSLCTGTSASPRRASSPAPTAEPRVWPLLSSPDWSRDPP